MSWSAPVTRSTGDFITAAIWNQDVVDNTNAEFPLGVDAWTSFTPTLTQSATLTKTVTYAKYQRIGRTVHCTMDLAITSAGTAGNAITVGLPVTAASANGICGSFRYLDSGTTIYSGTVTGDGSTTTVHLFSTNNANPFGVAPAVTAASGDTVQVQVTYEAAS